MLLPRSLIIPAQHRLHLARSRCGYHRRRQWFRRRRSQPCWRRINDFNDLQCRSVRDRLRLIRSRSRCQPQHIAARWSVAHGSTDRRRCDRFSRDQCVPLSLLRRDGVLTSSQAIAGNDSPLYIGDLAARDYCFGACTSPSDSTDNGASLSGIGITNTNTITIRPRVTMRVDSTSGISLQSSAGDIYGPAMPDSTFLRSGTGGIYLAARDIIVPNVGFDSKGDYLIRSSRDASIPTLTGSSVEIETGGELDIIGDLETTVDGITLTAGAIRVVKSLSRWNSASTVSALGKLLLPASVRPCLAYARDVR